jgi:hypothetical protein
LQCVLIDLYQDKLVRLNDVRGDVDRGAVDADGKTCNIPDDGPELLDEDEKDKRLTMALERLRFASFVADCGLS